MIQRVQRIAPVIALLALACSSESDGQKNPNDEQQPGTGGAPAAGDDAGEGGSPSGPLADGEWTSLASTDWKLDPGSEAPDWCTKITIPEDIYISAIRPVHPKGTHHTFVALSDTADGARCTTAVATGTLIYAAGVGSEGLQLPEGVAMKLPAGKVLNLSLHLYNPSDQELTGTSGMEIVKMDPADVKAEAGTMLAGPISITIPPGVHTISHECALTTETTGFALFPHMHQLGKHFKTTVTVGGVATVLHDGDYDFTEQTQMAIAPLHFMPGDTIATECTYENPGANTVTFGESSDTEMCFSVFFSYPATGRSFCGRPTAAVPQ